MPDLIDGASSSERTGPSVTFRSAVDVAPDRPEWLWDRWLAVGALHLLVGRQGNGKSTFAAWVVGNVSAGRHSHGYAGVARRCALLSLEEPAERLVARLHATAADLPGVLIFGDMEDFDEEGRPYRRPWRLPGDCSSLENVISEQGISLIVLDGLGYSLNGDTHNYGVVGSALSALAGVAERTGCAIVGLTHPPKGSSDPATIAIGSTAWTAVARVVWLLGVDPDNEDRRVVQVSKSNYKLPDAGLSFVIGDDDRFDCGYVTGIQSSHITAEAIAAASVPADEKTERQEAQEVVRQILADGPMETAELQRLTRSAGISDRTVERARRDLGVKAKPRNDPGTGKVSGWVVELPDHSAATPPLPGSGGVGGVGGVDVNRDKYNTPRIQTAKTANTASVGVGGDVAPGPFFSRDEF